MEFSLQKGECFGFLGPNGADKSTLMKMIYCFSSRTLGELSVFGLDADKDAAPIKNRIGVVAQSDNLDDEITVVQNLEIYAGSFGLPRKQTKAKSRIKELSGEMKRRLVIARALLNNPGLLILEEPTTGLDPQVDTSSGPN